MWTDLQSRILEFQYTSGAVLEADLRQLVQFGIVSDATEFYLALLR